VASADALAVWALEKLLLELLAQWHDEVEIRYIGPQDDLLD
jgi:hypothetical protein